MKSGKKILNKKSTCEIKFGEAQNEFKNRLNNELIPQKLDLVIIANNSF